MTAGNGVRSALWLIVIVIVTGSLPQFIPPAISAGEDEWGYHTSAQIATMISDLARSHPDRATATTAQKMFGTHPIEGGRTIPILFIGNSANNDNPNVMFLGAHHGNEPDSAEGVLGFASYLLEERTDINTQILDSVNIIVLPVVNPFGLDNGIRVDENGEDPNRDYPFAPSPPSSDSDGIPLTTQGARVVHELAKRYTISVALSFHTGSWGVFSTWGVQGLGNITPDHRPMMDVGRAMSKASAQRMPYGPANDYSGISYLTGAYDDHLYGSSLLPEKVFSSDMVLPYSTATFTIELGTQLGKEPSGLGSPIDMEGPKPSAKAIPTAIRICMAACMISSPSVSARLSGADVEFTVHGADSVGDMVLDEVRADGLSVLTPAIEIDAIYPIVSLGASPGSGASSVYLHGPIHPAWMDVDPNAYPPIAPRSLLAQSSMREVGEVLSIAVSSAPRPVRIIDMPLDVKVGASFKMIVLIDTSDRISDLTLSVQSGLQNKTYVFRGDILVQGENELTVMAPAQEGYAMIKAALRTSGGSFSDLSIFDVHPDLIWNIRLRGSWLDIYTDPVGLTTLRPIMVLLQPVGTGSIIMPDPFTFYIGPDGGMHTIDLSSLYGEYSVGVYIPPDDEGRVEIIDIPPTIIVSRVPIHITGGKMTIGPVTAYLGKAPIQWSGPFGWNNVTVILSTGSEVDRITLDYVYIESLTDGQRSIANDQAVMAGSAPSKLHGAFMKTIDMPGPGDYSVEGFLVNEKGEFRTQAGNSTERVHYDSFSIADGKGDFPYLLVLLFMALIGVMVVVSYLRFPAKMESLAKRELAKKDMEFRRKRR